MQESDNIIPVSLDNTPIQKTKTGVVLVGIVGSVFCAGIVTLGILALNSSRPTSGLVASITTEKPGEDLISPPKLDENGKFILTENPYLNTDVESARMVGELSDFGDAPEGSSVIGQIDYSLFGSFPTLLDNTIAGSIRHLETEKSFYLGLAKYNDGVTLEVDGNSVNLDEKDDGVLIREMDPCQLVSIEFEVTVPRDLPPPYYLNAAADWDRSGDWGGQSACRTKDNTIVTPEWFAQNIELGKLYNLAPGESRRLITPEFMTGPKNGKIWFRFTLGNEPVRPLNGDWDGSGYFLRGETEDYIVILGEDVKNEEEPSIPEETISGMVPKIADILIEHQFKDVNSSDWFLPYVQFVIRNEYMKGFADDTFRPHDSVNRSDIARIGFTLTGAVPPSPDTDKDGLLDIEEKLIGTDPVKKDTDGDKRNDYQEIMNLGNPLGKAGKLTDVPFPFDTIWSRHPARAMIAQLLTIGVLQTSDIDTRHRFFPDKPASKLFALTILMRSTSKISPGEDPLPRAYELGLVKDLSVFKKDDPVTRAELAKFISVLMQSESRVSP